LGQKKELLCVPGWRKGGKEVLLSGCFLSLGRADLAGKEGKGEKKNLLPLVAVDSKRGRGATSPSPHHPPFLQSHAWKKDCSSRQERKKKRRAQTLELRER